MGKNETKLGINWIKSFVETKRHTNIIRMEVPHRHDLIQDSCANKVEKFNSIIGKHMKVHENAEVVKVNLDRRAFTKHGQHMNAMGKEEIINHPIVRGRKIKIVTQMKYLGVILDSKLDWYPHTLYLENKVLSIRNNLIRCSTANWGLTFHNLLTIYNCAILPVITYASETWCTTV